MAAADSAGLRLSVSPAQNSTVKVQASTSVPLSSAPQHNVTVSNSAPYFPNFNASPIASSPLSTEAQICEMGAELTDNSNSMEAEITTTSVEPPSEPFITQPTLIEPIPAPIEVTKPILSPRTKPKTKPSSIIKQVPIEQLAVLSSTAQLGFLDFLRTYEPEVVPPEEPKDKPKEIQKPETKRSASKAHLKPAKAPPRSKTEQPKASSSIVEPPEGLDLKDFLLSLKSSETLSSPPLRSSGSREKKKRSKEHHVDTKQTAVSAPPSQHQEPAKMLHYALDVSPEDEMGLLDFIRTNPTEKEEEVDFREFMKDTKPEDASKASVRKSNRPKKKQQISLSALFSSSSKPKKGSFTKIMPSSSSGSVTEDDSVAEVDIWQFMAEQSKKTTTTDEEEDTPLNMLEFLLSEKPEVSGPSTESMNQKERTQSLSTQYAPTSLSASLPSLSSPTAQSFSSSAESISEKRGTKKASNNKEGIFDFLKSKKEAKPSSTSQKVESAEEPSDLLDIMRQESIIGNQVLEEEEDSEDVINLYDFIRSKPIENATVKQKAPKDILSLMKRRTVVGHDFAEKITKTDYCEIETSSLSDSSTPAPAPILGTQQSSLFEALKKFATKKSDNATKEEADSLANKLEEKAKAKKAVHSKKKKKMKPAERAKSDDDEPADLSHIMRRSSVVGKVQSKSPESIRLKIEEMTVIEEREKEKEREREREKEKKKEKEKENEQEKEKEKEKGVAVVVEQPVQKPPVTKRPSVELERPKMKREDSSDQSRIFMSRRSTDPPPVPMDVEELDDGVALPEFIRSTQIHPMEDEEGESRGYQKKLLEQLKKQRSRKSFLIRTDSDSSANSKLECEEEEESNEPKLWDISTLTQGTDLPRVRSSSTEVLSLPMKSQDDAELDILSVGFEAMLPERSLVRAQSKDDLELNRSRSHSKPTTIPSLQDLQDFHKLSKSNLKASLSSSSLFSEVTATINPTKSQPPATCKTLVTITKTRPRRESTFDLAEFLRSSSGKSRWNYLDIKIQELNCEEESLREDDCIKLSDVGMVYCIIACEQEQVRTADAAMNSMNSFQWDTTVPSDATFFIDSLEETNTFSITLVAAESHVALGKSTMKFRDLHDLAEIWVPVVSRNSTGLKLRILCSFVDEEHKGALSHLGLVTEAIPIRLKFGDLLLFNTSSLRTLGTKIVTRSRWDHVALVIEVQGKLALLEATSNEGVGLYDLTSRLLQYRKQCTIGVRRLLGKKMAKGALDNRKILNFIMDVRGRAYKTNVFELLRAVTPSVSHGEDLSSMFCSELVAATYRVAGLLSVHKVATEFAPKDFAADKFTLEGGARLSRVVEFPQRKDIKRRQKPEVNLQ